METDGPEIWPAVAPGPYGVGYRVLHEYDHTRTFRPKHDYFGQPTPGTLSRPLQISMWYPTTKSTDPPYMKLVEYYRAFATETDFTAPSDEVLGFTIARLRQAWPLEFRVAPEGRAAVRERIDAELEKAVFAVRDAAPADGRFPLIVHMPGYNGSPAGHAPLFEYLASHGYVVAAVPNMGRYQRNIDDEAASLDVQARDLEFAAARMRSLPFVDPSRTGTTGMSWGGMSNVLFAQRNSLIDAILTLDGAITMPEELKLIEAVPGYSHRSLNAAYMQLLVTPEEAEFRPKDLRFYDSLEYCDAHTIEFHDVNHDAFACGYLRLRNLAETDSGRISFLEEFTREVCQDVLLFFDAYLKDDSNALHTLAAACVESEDDAGQGDHGKMVAFRQYKAKKQRPLTRKDLVEIIRTRGADEALRVYDAYREIAPAGNLIVSSVIGPLYMDAFECGNFKEAMAICNLWETGLPKEPGPLFSKARIYTKTGEVEKAIQCYEKILTLVDEGRSAETARQRLDELRAGLESATPVQNE